MNTIDSILTTIRQAGGYAIVHNGDLLVKAPAGLLSDQDRQVLVEFKAQVLADQWDDLPASAPCSTCGGIEAWWDFAGRQHCSKCEADGLQRSTDLADLAAQLRRKSR